MVAEHSIKNFAVLLLKAFFPVPPKGVTLLGHQPGSRIEVKEKSDLNITCFANAKPPAEVNWYEDGKLINDGIHFEIVGNSDGTNTSYASLHYKPKLVLKFEAWTLSTSMDFVGFGEAFRAVCNWACGLIKHGIFNNIPACLV